MHEFHVTDKSNELTGQRDGGGETGCSGTSFLIDDGVCDEITNNARCLFDGGDCCLEKKITRLCQDCTCILEADPTELNRKLKQNRVKIFNRCDSDTNDINSELFVTVLTVEEVASKWVCYTICLALKPEVNSLTFLESTNNVCSAFTGCYYKEELMTIQDNRDLSKNGTDIVLPYVMLSAIPMCSKRKTVSTAAK